MCGTVCRRSSPVFQFLKFPMSIVTQECITGDGIFIYISISILLPLSPTAPPNTIARYLPTGVIVCPNLLSK